MNLDISTKRILDPERCIFCRKCYGSLRLLALDGKYYEYCPECMKRGGNNGKVENRARR